MTLVMMQKVVRESWCWEGQKWNQGRDLCNQACVRKVERQTKACPGTASSGAEWG